MNYIIAHKTEKPIKSTKKRMQINKLTIVLGILMLGAASAGGQVRSFPFFPCDAFKLILSKIGNPAS
jgi:hypothetical protein